MKLQEIIDNIDKNDIVKDVRSIPLSLLEEFNIGGSTNDMLQPVDNIRLTYYDYYYTVFHPDLRIWFLDDICVCVSFEVYDKSTNRWEREYYWLNQKGYNEVYKYLMKLDGYYSQRYMKVWEDDLLDKFTVNF